ncbi:hypothetical protein SKAU_G00004380 [Synaphobranchus kaupii]|uniref:Uncharacterized protein n=1 Tax=Synaphobranchus kaupii TaxID=118154 RepID=A0A9Q1G9T5_SYNKA|nr:hypothetical protein SKAU_G00004380 [Synaphobranchus kaupii]
MWGILAGEYDAFPAGVVSDKLIGSDDSEVPQPPWCQVKAFSHHPPLMLSEQTRRSGRRIFGAREGWVNKGHCRFGVARSGICPLGPGVGRRPSGAVTALSGGAVTQQPHAAAGEAGQTGGRNLGPQVSAHPARARPGRCAAWPAAHSRVFRFVGDETPNLPPAPSEFRAPAGRTRKGSAGTGARSKRDARQLTA